MHDNKNFQQSRLKQLIFAQQRSILLLIKQEKAQCPKDIKDLSQLICTQINLKREFGHFLLGPDCNVQVQAWGVLPRYAVKPAALGWACMAIWTEAVDLLRGWSTGLHFVQSKVPKNPSYLLFLKVTHPLHTCIFIL